VLPGAVLVLGGIAFADMLCEGAAADWAAVYPRNSLHTVAVVAGLAYAAYAAYALASPAWHAPHDRVSRPRRHAPNCLQASPIF
jgi:hypothetical protein